MRAINLEGRKFGRLLVLRKSTEKRSGRLCWDCVCDCGKTKIAMAKTLVNGGTKSCGCLFLDHSKTKIKKINQKTKRPLFSERDHCGYVETKTKAGWMKRGVYALEKYLGRPLLEGEVCHHCDMNKKNDSLDNLELMTHGGHSALHNKKRKMSDSCKKAISDAHKRRTIEKGHIGRKLTAFDVFLIKIMLARKESYSLVATMFSVSKGSIAAINQKRTWRTVC